MRKRSSPSRFLGMGLGMLALLGAGLWGQSVVVVTSGPIAVNSEVHFRFDHAGGGGGGATYVWNFGDGGSETTANNQARHVFRSAGGFRVTCQASIPGAGSETADVMVTVVDNRRVTAQGGAFRVGRRVGFQADGFASASLTWNFGDGVVENGPRNHGHAFPAPGSFRVQVYEAGEEGNAVAVSVNVGPDDRRLTAEPPAPRANQAVAFSAQNFAGGGLRWDFGDGPTQNGGASQSHVFRQPGSFQVRVWESDGAADDAVTLTVPVAPDSRQLQVQPAPPRAGSLVRFTAQNFAGADLRWNFGDGPAEGGGASQTHVFRQPGSFQVQVWDAGEGQETAVRLSLSVQPDARQLAIAGPADVFEGAEVVFEARNFSAPQLSWDFGDGTVESGGARQAHRFARPGSFAVRVVEADSGNLPLEKRVQVLNDNRALVPRTSVVYAGGDFEIEAQNFRSGTVAWDFGDGALLSGPRQMKHRYARSGQYRVRAVDFSGRDGKAIERLLQVDNDPRLVLLPAEIIAGEKILMRLQNAGPGSFTWRFSDGDSRGGAELRDKAFRSPGPHTLTVLDPSGKLPPLEKALQVVPDVRALKSSTEFALPKEGVTFTAAGFRGPGVRWDFGDGTVKEGGALSETHAYADLGRFRVKAVDFNGASSKEFAVDVVVADLAPGFEVTTLEFAFDNGKYYRVIPKNGPAPACQLRVKAKGRGVLSGHFLLDGASIGLFQLVLAENQAATLPRAQLPALPAIDLGLHELTLKFSNYSFNRRIPIIKYFVTTAGAIRVVSPPLDARVPAGGPIELAWAFDRKKARFEVAVSAVPLQFLDDRQIEWKPASGASGHRVDPAAFKPGDWVYWQVRLVGDTGVVLTTSEIAAFRLAE
jgi:PKD repeat protein